MTKEDRIEALKQVVKAQQDEPYGITHVYYNGENKKFSIYEIPLDLILYNKFNGRILSRSLSYEKEYHELDNENAEDINTIEDFLWESKSERNEATLKDLRRNGQRDFGIITRDGVVIDGNRRTLLLNKLHKDEKLKHFSKFRAIILDDNLEGNEKEILELETTYQMGLDKKLDYNPIEKYLKCAQMKAHFNISEIADFMSETIKRIEEWLSIKELMDEYLASLGYDGIYTRLDKREGHFVDLNNYLGRYIKDTVKVKREVDDFDLAALKAIYFDYIRVPFPVQYCRIIAKPSEKYSFYCHEHGQKIWEPFSTEHFEVIEEIEEKSLDILKEENPGVDLASLLRQRDKDWADNVKDKLEANLENVERTLNDVNISNAPLELLKRAKNTLGAIDTSVTNFRNDPQIEAILVELRETINSLETKRTN